MVLISGKQLLSIHWELFGKFYKHYEHEGYLPLQTFHLTRCSSVPKQTTKQKLTSYDK